MKIRELIEKLEQLKNEHGDLEVRILQPGSKNDLFVFSHELVEDVVYCKRGFGVEAEFVEIE